MFRLLVLLITIAVTTSTFAESASQTDWSGGPGVAGPVPAWENSFDVETEINWWTCPDQLILDYATPLEQPVASYSRVRAAHPLDVDGDGYLDLLGSSGRYAPPYFFSGRVDWWRNNDGLGTSWTRVTVDDNYYSAPSVCGVDVDGDGDADVAAVARDNPNGVVWWENADSTGTAWIENPIPSSIQYGSSIWAADLNSDDYMDIVCCDASYNRIVWLKNVDGTGTSWTEHLIDNFTNPEDVHVADMDGDEDMDVLGASYNSDRITWWENADGVGTSWLEHEVDNSFNGARSVYTADIDGDGDRDVLGAAALAWSVTWWENSNGDGTSWIEHNIHSNFNWAWSVHSEDMDNDGDMDVLGAAYFGNSIVWWENIGGNGLLWIEHTVNSNFVGAQDVNSADLNSDGKSDLLGAAYEAGQITWWDVNTYLAAGELVSSILDVGVEAAWDSLNWTAVDPLETSLCFQVRSGTDPQSMGAWSADITAPGSLGNHLTAGDQFVQYRAILETVDPGITPVLEEVTISWGEFLGIDDIWIEYNPDDNSILLGWSYSGEYLHFNIYRDTNPYFLPAPENLIGVSDYPGYDEPADGPGYYYRVTAVVE